MINFYGKQISLCLFTLDLFPHNDVYFYLGKSIRFQAMTSVATSLTAVKFVNEPSSYIVCQLCKNVYTNPVISVRCGHTYCMRCLTKPSAAGDCLSVVRCPQDGVECNTTELVMNRFTVFLKIYFNLI